MRDPGVELCGSFAKRRPADGRLRRPRPLPPTLRRADRRLRETQEERGDGVGNAWSIVRTAATAVASGIRRRPSNKGVERTARGRINQ